MKSLSVILGQCVLTLLLTSSWIPDGNGENVMAIVAVMSKSHKNVLAPIVSGLAERNHTVTFISAHPPTKTQKNVRELVLYDFQKLLTVFGEPLETRARGVIGMLRNTSGFDAMFDGCHDVWQAPEFMPLLDEKWDLVLVDGMMQDCFAGFIHKTGAPFIIVSTLPVPGAISAYAGNRLPLSFVPHFMMPYSDSMTFLQRVANMMISVVFDAFNSLKFHPKAEAIYRKYLGQDAPGLLEIYSNVSMIFSNSHLSLTVPRPFLPDIQEVGGMHCKPPKPLQADLEKFVSGAEHGLILFSLGSIVQANQMPQRTSDVFKNVFGRLKQRVLWKWETEQMPDLPSNVRLSKWVPQQDILGHPKIRLFISHGGLLSTQEAAFYGVPILGVPIFGDQDLNAQQAELAGYGLAIEILDITEEVLEAKINQMLTETRFSERAKELSVLFRDQNETPLRRAVFWSEYVMRHKGARHLRSAARDLNFFQYHSIDVIATLLSVLLLSLWMTKWVLCTIWGKLCGGKKSPNQVEKAKKRQ